MAQNFELIGLLAGIVITVWVALEVCALGFPLPRKRNLQSVSDYFLLSFAFFFIGLVTEYQIAQPWRILDLYYSVLLEAFAVVLGLFTLVVGVWGLRQTGRSGRRTPRLPEQGSTILVALYAGANGLLIVTIGYRYSLLPTVTKIFFWLLCLSIPASFVRLTIWHGFRKRENLAMLMILSAWIYIAVAFLLVESGVPLLEL